MRRESVYDEVLLPALSYAKQDQLRDEIVEADAQFVLQATREIVQELGQDATRTGELVATRPTDEAERPQRLVLLCPAKDEFDAVAVAMGVQVIDAARWQVEMVGTALLTAEVTQLVDDRRPTLVCIASVAPGGLSHTRHLCKRLRARFPGLTLVVGRLGMSDDPLGEQRQLADAGADRVALSVLELERHLDELSLLTESVPPSAEALPVPQDATPEPARAS